MFQVVMNKQTTELQGTKEELLKGLCYYIEALNKGNISLNTIQEVSNYAIKELSSEASKKKTSKVKKVHREDNFTIHEINTEGMTKEEIKNIITDIINNKM